MLGLEGIYDILVVAVVGVIIGAVIWFSIKFWDVLKNLGVSSALSTMLHDISDVLANPVDDVLIGTGIASIGGLYMAKKAYSSYKKNREQKEEGMDNATTDEQKLGVDEQTNDQAEKITENTQQSAEKLTDIKDASPGTSGAFGNLTQETTAFSIDQEGNIETETKETDQIPVDQDNVDEELENKVDVYNLEPEADEVSGSWISWLLGT